MPTRTALSVPGSCQPKLAPVRRVVVMLSRSCLALGTGGDHLGHGLFGTKWVRLGSDQALEAVRAARNPVELACPAAIDPGPFFSGPEELSSQCQLTLGTSWRGRYISSFKKLAGTMSNVLEEHLKPAHSGELVARLVGTGGTSERPGEALAERGYSARQAALRFTVGLFGYGKYATGRRPPQPNTAWALSG